MLHVGDSGLKPRSAACLRGKLPQFHIAEPDFTPVVLEQEVSLDLVAESCGVLELARCHGCVDRVAATLVFEDLIAVEPMLDMVALDQNP